MKIHRPLTTALAVALTLGMSGSSVFAVEDTPSAKTAMPVGTKSPDAPASTTTMPADSKPSEAPAAGRTTGPAANPATGAAREGGQTNNTDDAALVAGSALLHGANSFTEAQAKGRLEKHGFSGVTDPKIDKDGIWRAKGTRDGKTVDLGLDYMGHVSAE